MTPPRRMTEHQIGRLRDFIAIAESHAFDALDLVEHAGDYIEGELRAAVDHLANALDRADHIATRASRDPRTAREMVRNLANPQSEKEKLE